MPPTTDSPRDAELLALEDACRGRFALERELGRGGMGIVVLARDLALDRQVAIKLLPAALARMPQLRERFLREARTAAGLAHPNIVAIHAVEAVGDVVFFVMGYVEGETLARRVARGGPLPPAEATRVLREVAWALAYAHGRGVVHRDVKPDNILLDRASGRALVTDFGIARVADAATSLTLDGQVMGTAQYMSPEQAAGEPLDGRSDLYSLGAVGHVALTGRPPFEAPTAAALLAMRLMQAPPPVASRRAGVPPALAAAVDRCLAQRPEDRFPSAEALADALEDAGGRVADVAPQVRNFVRMAEQSTLMLSVMLPLMLSLATASGGRSALATIGGVVGALLSVMFDLGRRARLLLLQGFSAGDAMRGFLLEDDRRGQEIQAIYGGPYGVRLAHTRRRAFVVAAALLGLVLAARPFVHAVPRGTPAGIAGRVVLITVVFVAVLALLVALNSSPSAERRGGRAMARLWRGGFTFWFFRMAGLGLGRELPVAGPDLAGPAEEPELPAAALHHHPELPRLLRAARELVRALSTREGEIERVLAESGAARGDELPPGGATTRAELVSRRVSLVAELRGALESTRARRADVVAASENVRIQLARLRAGLADAADVAPDVRELAALLDDGRAPSARVPDAPDANALRAVTP